MLTHSQDIVPAHTLKTTDASSYVIVIRTWETNICFTNVSLFENRYKLLYSDRNIYFVFCFFRYGEFSAIYNVYTTITTRRSCLQLVRTLGTLAIYRDPLKYVRWYLLIQIHIHTHTRLHLHSYTYTLTLTHAHTRAHSRITQYYSSK